MIVEDVNASLAIFDFKSTTEAFDVNVYLPDSNYRGNVTLPPIEKRRLRKTLGSTGPSLSDNKATGVSSYSRNLAVNFASVNIFTIECLENVDPERLRVSFSTSGGRFGQETLERISKGYHQVKFALETAEPADVLGPICNGIENLATACPVIMGKCLEVRNFTSIRV